MRKIKNNESWTNNNKELSPREHHHIINWNKTSEHVFILEHNLCIHSFREIASNHNQTNSPNKAGIYFANKEFLCQVGFQHLKQIGPIRAFMQCVASDESLTSNLLVLMKIQILILPWSMGFYLWLKKYFVPSCSVWWSELWSGESLTSWMKLLGYLCRYASSYIK